MTNVHPVNKLPPRLLLDTRSDDGLEADGTTLTAEQAFENGRDGGAWRIFTFHPKNI
ncbi:hypothetical protein L1285_15475 [Pseudoalteromonas sp. DL2-H2.2]|uniref:hypothetical protein n=1 Tax=Pseudoalteromonas sp. DL2-H2.2 TaxID=2908889 RepID=UPI001F3CA1E9|nr:hypothetical protein [Pseudoalteromonas sp. DL2-H2.2]MCF2909725.1 hypothetical protein [Pseudoalteromonas sp. DL2-H2.2]